jgi:hypothetical protein
MRAVLVNSQNVVFNAIIIGDGYEPPEDTVMVITDIATIGDIYNPVDGTFTSPSVVVPIPLADLKEARLLELNNTAQALADQATAGYPGFEIQTWPDQRRESTAWQADNTALTPYIDLMASYRGVTRENLLARTVAAVEAFSAYFPKVVGRRQKYADEIAAATTAEALNAIVFDFDFTSE